MNPSPLTLKSLLPHGSIKTIADKLGLSIPAVSRAIKKGKPGHPAIQEALRLIADSGALAAAQALATIAATR